MAPATIFVPVVLAWCARAAAGLGALAFSASCLAASGGAAPGALPQDLAAVSLEGAPELRASEGADFHVASTGADTNPGTRALPFRTIQRAASAARPGSTIYVAPGTYVENIATHARGSKRAPIRYVSETKWGAKIVGSGTEAAWTNHGDYTEIRGFDITGSGRLGILNRGSHTLIVGNHVHDLAISGGCTGEGGAGIMNGNYRASDGDIIGNVVHDIGVPGACNAVQGIYHTNLRGRIYNNIVYRASAFGIHLWHAANRVVIANNTTFANGSSGMGGGIVIGAGDKPGGVVLDHTKVVNNIVYDNPHAAILEFCYPEQDCTGPNNTIANNLVYRNGSKVKLRAGKAKNTISADPQFVDYKADGSGDYRLRRTSPAVNKGVAMEALGVDIDAARRPHSAGHDIGAYENF